MSISNESDAASAEGGIRTSVVESIVALVLLGLGLVIVYSSLQLGAGWSTDGPGPGYFPFYIGLILAISGTAVFLQTVFGKNKSNAIFVRNDELRRVLSVLLPAIVFVLGIYVLGIYVASAIYIALFMMILGGFSKVKSALIGVGVNTVFFLMFEVWFKVPLYKGLLEPLRFLGY